MSYTTAEGIKEKAHEMDTTEMKGKYVGLISWYSDGNLSHGHDETHHRAFLLNEDGDMFMTKSSVSKSLSEFKKFIAGKGWPKPGKRTKVYSSRVATPAGLKTYIYSSFGPSQSASHTYHKLEKDAIPNPPEIKWRNLHKKP